MNITTLQERIDKANIKIQKKEALIARIKKNIEKKQNALVKFGWDLEDKDAHIQSVQSKGFQYEDAYQISDLISDIDHLEDDIERNTRQIEETRNTIAKYEKQLAGEIERDAIFAREIPESMKAMQDELETRWNEWDINRREFLLEEKKKLGFREFLEKYHSTGYDLIHKSDADIRKENKRDAKNFTLDLYNRVKEITGEVTDWYGIKMDVGTHGNPTLNGVVYGKEGNAVVDSIYAGGYNIQRLHVRVLVKPF